MSKPYEKCQVCRFLSGTEECFFCKIYDGVPCNFMPADLNLVDQDYRNDSVVATRKGEIENLVNAHWNYVEKVIKSGADTRRSFTFDEVMEMRKWDYTSAAFHFYGHGFEDGQFDSRNKALNRLKEK